MKAVALLMLLVGYDPRLTNPEYRNVDVFVAMSQAERIAVLCGDRSEEWGMWVRVGVLMKIGELRATGSRFAAGATDAGAALGVDEFGRYGEKACSALRKEGLLRVLDETAKWARDTAPH